MRIEHRDRLLRKELRKLLPVSKDDVAAIEAIGALGYPAVEPICLDWLKWIRIEEWPVAKPVCEFLVTIGPQLVPQVREVLGSRQRDDSWKAVVLRRIVSEWPSDGVRELQHELSQIAIHGQPWGGDLLALRLLARHGLGDPQWITELLEFKRAQHENCMSEIEKTRRMLQG